MLKCLSIDNYALIDHLIFKPSNGFVVITGETGAGKSIIMGALGLILGQRSDAKSLKNPDKKCTIEGTFDLKGLNLHHFFEENELDYEDLTLIRREIAPTGKSRSFINDTPVTLTQLKEITEQLIDIHSQHQNLLIKDKHFHLTLLDCWSENESLLANYQKSYSEQKECKKALEEKREQLLQKMKDRDYIAFQFQQLSEANLEENEQETLEQALKELEHAEEIKAALNFTETYLLHEESGAQLGIRNARSAIHKITTFSTKYEQLEERLQSVAIELEDLSSEIERINEDLIFDPIHLAQIKERLDLIYSLQQKHHVDTIQALLQLQEGLDLQLQELDDSDTLLIALEKDYDNKRMQAETYAQELTQRRTLAIPAIEQSVIALLQQLGMPNVQLKMEIKQEAALHFFGCNDVSMHFAANKGSKLNRVEDTASGGEIARLLLSIKAVMAKKRRLSSIIFDEIDTGVSGEIAHRMGEIMREMSQSMQVICITHLPQIGARGTAHYKVYKKIEQHTTQTDIQLLTAEERVSEIAYMLSGEQLTPAALNNARELLN